MDMDPEMSIDFDELDRLRLENEELKMRLEEAEGTLDAIRSGEVDALLVGDSVYTLSGAETPYRILVEQMQEGAATISGDGTVLSANRRMAEIFKGSLETLIGYSIYNFVLPEDQAAFRSFFCMGLAGKAHAEYALKAHDGSEVLAHLAVSRLPLGGEIASLVVTDITGIRRVEAERNELDAKLHTLVDESPGGMYIIQDRRFIYTNMRFTEIVGYPPEEIIGAGVLEWLHPEDRKALEEISEKELSGEVPRARAVFRVIRKDGDTGWLEITSLGTTYLGKPAIIGTALDITDRKRAEEELVKSEERFRLLFESIPDAVLIVDPVDGGIITVNEAASILFGYTRAEFERAFYNTIFAEPACIPGSNGAPELIFVRKNGEHFTGETAYVNYFDRSGKEIQSVIIRDVTKLRELEHARADFVSMLTHDLKSPLTTIMGYADLLASSEDMKPDKAEMVWSIQRSSEKMMRMVEDFLLVSRLEAAKMQIAPMPEYVNQLLERVAKDFKPAAEKKGVRLDTDFGEIPPACVDIKYMERSVGNLLQNAINYTPPGGRVVLKAEGGTRGDGRRKGQYLAVTVEDTGAGIPEEYRGRIFDRYFTTARARGVKGTGLGLAIVKAVAEAHGGRAAVESEPGKGSAFHIYMPLRADC